MFSEVDGAGCGWAHGASIVPARAVPIHDACAHDGHGAMDSLLADNLYACGACTEITGLSSPYPFFLSSSQDADPPRGL